MADQDACGCCAGLTAETPTAVGNAPGLPAVGYRIGTQPSFRASLLARLSSTDYPSLAPLTARENDDWTIALCDAFACAADVLTFYQERIANESYLRTATERRSVIELARLIGYKPAPGVAASTALAFTLEPAPGQPALAAQPVTIAAGTRVQSIPDPGQTAQTFETGKDVPARVEWNAMPAQSALWPPFADGVTDLYVAGTGLQIQPGDAIALVSAQRMDGDGAGLSDVRWLDRVEEDSARNITRLLWTAGLSAGWNAQATGWHVYVFRQRAALFGANAPDADLVYTATNAGLFTHKPPGAEWKGFDVSASEPVDLDALYPKATNGGWFVLYQETWRWLGPIMKGTMQVRPAKSAHGGTGTLEQIGGSYVSQLGLYRISAASQLSRSGFGLSARITRLNPDVTDGLDQYPRRDTIVLLQSDELIPAPRPLRYPVFGSTVVLDVSEPALAPGRKIAVTGKRQRIALPRDTRSISFPDDLTRQPLAGESFRMAGAPLQQVGANQWQALTPADLPGSASNTTWLWPLIDHDDTPVRIQAPAGALLLIDALKDDEALSEVATLDEGADALTATATHTTLQWQAPLANCYDRRSFAVNANVADATHGETVSEIAGSGNASLANQAFQLRQSPLTYVSSSAAEGASSTLQVRVNNLLWQEQPALYAEPPKAHVYETSQDDNSVTTLQFGDGVDGARLPTGQNNIRLQYRKGLGTAGNLRAGQLTSLLTRPLGVKAVVNANDATGGQDPEVLEAARMNAPLRILTLDRAVSANDYGNYARAFAGIAKAHALWIDSGTARGVYLSVAGAGGSAIPAGSDTQANLIQSLRNHGDPLIPIAVQSYAKATFTLKVAILCASDADPKIVTAAVDAALRAAYAFDARDFGQAVTIDEVYAVIQAVDGVLAADIQQLYRVDSGPLAPQPAPQLAPAMPALQSDGTVSAAGILTLDPKAIDIGEMT